MKKITSLVFTLFLFALFTASCKKTSNENNDSYVKFKMNGTWINYKGLGELGPDLGDDTKTDLGITGYSKDNKNVLDISIQVDGSGFNTGLYSSDKYPEYYMIVDYSENPDPSTMKWYEIDDALNQPPSLFTVHISSITPTQIKGTFTGNYLYDNNLADDADGGIVRITEGVFQVKRIR